MTDTPTVSEHLNIANVYLNRAIRYRDTGQDLRLVIADATIASAIYLMLLLSQQIPLHEPPQGESEK